MSDTNQVPHPGPTFVRRHRTKISRPSHPLRCISVPLVPVSGGCQVYDGTQPPPPPLCSLPDPKQVCGKFIAGQRKPAETAHRSVWTVRLAVPLCRQPFVITRHSSWLFTFAEYCCRDRCSTAVCSDCMCFVWRCGNPTAEMCFCCGSTGGGRCCGCPSVAGVSLTHRTEKIARRLRTRYLYVQLYF